ncbi:MAG: twin-arginine translocation signal domain-containing protein [Acidimicrobiales bacterium]
MHNHAPDPELTRRQFLGFLAAGAGALMLTACTDDAPAELQLVSLFSPDRVIVAGIEQRLPFGVVGNGISLVGEGEPVSVRILSDGAVIDDYVVPGRVVGHDHPEGNAEAPHSHSSILRYYALRATLPSPGVYDLEVTYGSQTARLPVQAFAQADVAVLGVGQQFPAVTTPTTTDHIGVEPLCTRAPEPCPFHDHTPAELLAAGQPFVLLVATPAYCATAYCGPGLDVLIEAKAAIGDLAVIHAEVYANPDEVGGNIASPDIRHAPIIEQLGLTFEPSLFLIDASGIVVERIDNVFDRTEFDAVVTQLLS